MSENTILIIIIIILILIFVLLYKLLHKNKNNEMEIIYGGEGPKGINYRNNKDEHIIQPSELVLSQTRAKTINNNIYYNKSDLKYFMGQSFSKFKDMNSIMLNNYSYLISKNIQPKFFSDSLLDGIGLAKLLNYSTILTKCEMPTNTSINEGMLKNPNNLSSIIERDEDDIIISDFDSTKFGKKFKSSKPEINIYIEFCYNNFTNDKFKIIDLYPKIHLATISIIEKIIKANPINNDVYIFRYLIDKDGLTNKTDFDKTVIFNNVNFHYYDENDGRFDTIIIPPTENVFFMDEFLLVNYNNQNFNIQIEHSENMEMHKSNLVEFLMRMGDKFDISNDDLFKLIRSFGYLTNMEKTIKLSLNTSNVIDPDNLCYKLIKTSKIPDNSVFIKSNPSFFSERIKNIP